MMFKLLPKEESSLANFNPSEFRISIFADSTNGLANAQSVAERVGARILFSGAVSDGRARLSDYPAGDAIFVDVAHDGQATLDMFLDHIDALSRSDRIPVLINSSSEVLDLVAARITAPSVGMMSQANAADWIATLAIYSTGHAPMLHDATVDDSLRLQRLADEVQRIARTLSDLVGDSPAPIRGVSDALIGFRAEPTRYAAPPQQVTAADVRAIIRLRRMRDRFFRSDLFADPAWDMLLDLMAARLERMRVAVSSLCIAAAVPPTTALRWIKTMTDNGMFVRVADPEDGRRVFIELSDGAASGLAAYLNAAKASGGLAV
jgi:hypothetical protein